MQIEYHKWFSPILGHDMELKVYGYYGKLVLVFPSQQGRFHDFEDWGMMTTLARFIESGQIKLFAVDSLDSQSWANWVRIRRPETSPSGL
jgi:esterase/lipase superfamily enzyme